MKVFLGESVKGLRKRVEEEGDEVVEKGWEREICREEEKIEKGSLDLLGFETGEEKDVRFFLAKSFCAGELGDQTIVGLPIVGMMDGGLGAREIVGWGTRFVTFDERIKLFRKACVQELVRSLKAPGGFLGIWFDKDSKVIKISTFLPPLAFYPLMENVKSKISDFYEHRLRPSWSVGYMLTASPFPGKKESYRRFAVKVPKVVRTHYSHFGGFSRDTYYSDTLDVGVVTAWSDSLKNACSRVQRTMENIDFEGKQHRLDLFSSLSSSWHWFTETNPELCNKKSR